MLANLRKTRSQKLESLLAGGSRAIERGGFRAEITNISWILIPPLSSLRLDSPQGEWILFWKLSTVFADSTAADLRNFKTRELGLRIS